MFLFRTGNIGEEELCSGVSSTLGHARSEASKRLNWFLTRDRTRFTTLFGIVLLCLFSTVARVVPITASRHGTNSLLETLFGRASGPCVHVETHVARTTASLRMTAFASLETPSKKQHVLNVVHKWLSRVVIVGSANFRCWLHLQCLPVPRDLPRDLPRRTVFRQASVLDWCRCRNRTRLCLESLYEVVGHCRTSDVFGEGRPESLHGLGCDLTRGSFEEMRAKVTCPITCECLSLQNIDAHLSLFFTSPNDAKNAVL